MAQKTRSQTTPVPLAPCLAGGNMDLNHSVKIKHQLCLQDLQKQGINNPEMFLPMPIIKSTEINFKIWVEIPLCFCINEDVSEISEKPWYEEST